MGSLSFSTNKPTKTSNIIVYEADSIIFISQKRFAAMQDNDNKYTLIYEIQHPAKPSPCDWSEWLKPAYALKDGMEIFSLCSGRDPKSKMNTVPANAPEIRFKVIKEQPQPRWLNENE